MVIADYARLPDHAMARNQIRQRILTHYGSDGACGGGLVNHARQSSITGERAGLDLQQRPPDAHLKRRAANERAQRSAGLRPGALSRIVP